MDTTNNKKIIQSVVSPFWRTEEGQQPRVLSHFSYHLEAFISCHCHHFNVGKKYEFTFTFTTLSLDQKSY
jgi:hypothetical protein